MALPSAFNPHPDRYRSHTYYVNAEIGTDDGTGASASHPWKTIARANAVTLAPGDRLLFAGGQTFKGALIVNKETQGEAQRPILISSYGKGRATIDGGSGDGCRLTDCTFVRLASLDFVGCGRKNGSDGAGISLVRTRNVEIDNVEVSRFRNAGISTEGDENTRITHAYAHDNGAAGITTAGGYNDVPRTRNLYIGYCRADNNPGDPKNLTNHSGNGIVVGGLDGALIEYCEASENGWDMPRTGNGPVGIWGWNCDRLTIQHCISHDNKSPGADGGGFDLDGGVTNSVLQYNLAYHNTGCGYLLCQYPGAPRWRHNIMRYNISLNDGIKNFHSGIGLWNGGDDFSDAQVYNNTIINAHHAVSTLGEAPGFVYRNNIFVAGDHVLDATLGGGYDKDRFEHNLYWSTGQKGIYRDEKRSYATLAEWRVAALQEMSGGNVTGIWSDPQLRAISLPLPTDPVRLKALAGFRLLANSPAIRAGITIADNGDHDFCGHVLVSGARPALGALDPDAR
jgi:hypothetical protein